VNLVNDNSIPSKNFKLLPKHQTLIDDSAISPEVAAARGYRSMGSRYDLDTLKDAGFSKIQSNIPGLLMPRYNLRGEQDGYQYRPDKPKDGRPKYETPKGQRNILDVNPLMADAFRQGGKVIFITEGARKADALASIDILAISLAGVYGWRGKNEEGGTTALADWEDVAIKGNVFVLAFDSDIITKEEVYQALTRLRSLLLNRGAAKARVLVLPQLLSGKTGIDDYIADTGAAAKDLAKLIIDGLPAMDESLPMSQPVDLPPLSDLLDTVAHQISQYVVLTDHQVVTVTLWICHTHSYQAADITPYINPRSAEKRSGKTRLIEVVQLLVSNPLKADNISVAALARLVDGGATLLLDEVDAIFGKGKSVSETQDSLRGILNGGFQRNGTYVRMVGQGASMEPQAFSTFGPKLLSGIGELPGTLNDRSIPIYMKRKLASDAVARFSYRRATVELTPIKATLAAWGVTAIEELQSTRPDVLKALDDRAFDSWEPLLAIADMAGGDWPHRARMAALAISGNRVDEDDSRGVRLLSDIKYVFGESGKDRLSTKALLVALNAREESPWGAYRKEQGMDSRTLARILKPYEIEPGTIRLPDGSTPKGYYATAFEDALARYVDSLPATNATPVYDVVEEPNLFATRQVGVAHENNAFTGLQTKCGGVADKNQYIAPLKDCGPCRGLRSMCSKHRVEAGL
jgi:hypothetical protein